MEGKLLLHVNPVPQERLVQVVLSVIQECTGETQTMLKPASNVEQDFMHQMQVRHFVWIVMLVSTQMKKV